METFLCLGQFPVLAVLGFGDFRADGRQGYGGRLVSRTPLAPFREDFFHPLYGPAFPSAQRRDLLGDALAKVPPEVRAPYTETWIDAEVKHMKELIAAAQVQRQSYSAATAVYKKNKGPADALKAALLDNLYLKAGKDAYGVYWNTIHDAYFTYRGTLEPAEADLLVAEAKAKDKSRETYINIYKNPNIGLVRNVSGQSEDEVFQKAEAERQRCPY